MFLERAPLTLRLEGDFRALFRDRGAQRKDHPATLRYGTAADTGSIDVKLRTRGIFRLRTCGFPPIRLDLPSKKVDDTPFAGEDKLKLVTHCQGDRSYERNLLREYALYRALNALTDTSFRVRLAHAALRTGASAGPEPAPVRAERRGLGGWDERPQKANGPRREATPPTFRQRRQ